MVNDAIAICETELLLQTAKGDCAAFEQLFKTYQPSLLFLVHKITRNISAAEEIVQDVFLKIWLTRETLSEIENFKNYLFIVSRNQALNLLDKELRTRRRHNEYENEIKVVTETPQEDAYHLIDEAISQLPQQQRAAWLLSRHEGLSYEKIAMRMNLSEKTVKRHIRLATDSLKDYILQHNTELALLLLLACFL
jgi:RNA polymerase sigma-70 factor (ECF subfamily)